MSDEKVCSDVAAGKSAAPDPTAIPPLPSAPGEVDALRAQIAIVSDRLAKIEAGLGYCVTVNVKVDGLLKRFAPVLEEGAAAVTKATDPKTGKLSDKFWASLPAPVRWVLGK